MSIWDHPKNLSDFFNLKTGLASAIKEWLALNPDERESNVNGRKFFDSNTANSGKWGWLLGFSAVDFVVIRLSDCHAM